MKKISLFLILALAFSLPVSARTDTEGIIRKIEMRRGLWVSLKATLSMEFSTPQDKKAACRAELVYDRLDERILLKGFNEKNEPLFMFRTDDRNFDLYLPPANTVFSGSIFDLEDSPQIHSHLKALDLYRALKPMALPAGKTSVANEDGLLKLEIKNRKDIERALFANENGDTVKEIYYRRGGVIKTSIERSGFKEFKKNKETFAFPSVIRIESYAAAGENKTLLNFESSDFNPIMDEGVFNLELPRDARRADVAEEFRKQQASASD